MAETRREYIERRRQAMKNERSSFDPHWREVAEYIQPRMGRFLITDVNKGDRRFRSIINSTGTTAHEVARAGLHAGVMSPARPWFRLGTVDPDLKESYAVQVWLHKVQLLLQTIFAKSNLYSAAPAMFGELLLFGSGAMFHLDNFDTVARFRTLTAGQYYLAQNENFEVDTIGLEYTMTVRQMVERFGTTVSKSVMNAYDRGQYDDRFDVMHFVEPNSRYEADNPISSRLAFASTYAELGNEKRGAILEEKGFHEFPCHALRWEVTGEDVYATNCPGMAALGDVKGLQIAERRLAQGIDKQVNPPLKGPSSLKGESISSLPGGVTLYDGDPAREQLQPLYTVAPQTQELVRNIERMEIRVRRTFKEDLFRSIASLEGVQPQNQMFLSQLSQEKLLELGPVLEQLQGAFLGKLIDRAFNQAARAKILPEPPPELQGQPLEVEYLSTLLLAQRSVITSSIDRLFTFAAGLAQAGYPQAVDKLDADQAIDEYSRAIGAPPTLVVPDAQVQQLREQRAQQQQQAQAMQMMQQGASAAKSLADAKMGEPNALTALTGGGA